MKKTKVLQDSPKMDARLILGHLPRTVYMNSAEKMPVFLSRKIMAASEMLKKGEKKISRNVDILFCDYSEEAVERIIRRLGRRAAFLRLPKFSEFGKGSEMNSYFHGYEGISGLLAEQTRHIENATKKEKLVYSKEFLRLFEKYYIIFRNMIEEHKVKAVFLTGLIGIYESALLQLSLEGRIKIFCSQHGFYNELYPGTKLLKNVFFFASGEEEKRTLLKCGIQPGNIFITGSPFFDKIAKYRKTKKGKGRKTILLLTQCFVEDKDMEYDDYFSFIETILNDILHIRECSIIIKLHPREKHKSKYEEIARKFGIEAEIIQKPGKDALYNAISKSDLVIGFGSTAEMEALMLDKDVLTVDLRKQPVGFGYTKFVINAKRSEMSRAFIERILNYHIIKYSLMKKRREYVRKNFFKLDGNASARVASIIRKLL